MNLYRNLKLASQIFFCTALLLNANTSLAKSVKSDSQDVEVSDPLESANRAVYGFNRALDNVLFKPVAKTYRFIVPELGRKGIRNVLTNLTEPVTFINAVLQGDKQHSFTTFWRFTINTTWGIGGLFDVASQAGLQNRKEDFGQTMGYYGSKTGPYLMLPILGPSNVRDTFGLVADAASDPFNYIFEDDALIGLTALRGLDAREANLDTLDEIDRVSLDPYAAIRSLYTQKRDSKIKNLE
jgi:phospholipid-binding lipoprotein MlaA